MFTVNLCPLSSPTLTVSLSLHFLCSKSSYIADGWSRQTLMTKETVTKKKTRGLPNLRISLASYFTICEVFTVVTLQIDLFWRDIPAELSEVCRCTKVTWQKYADVPEWPVKSVQVCQSDLPKVNRCARVSVKSVQMCQSDLSKVCRCTGVNCQKCTDVPECL
jgi:hypothetical protein